MTDTSLDKKNPGVPTPRTDAEASAADDFVVSAEFARQLERELTEAKVLLHNQAQAVIAMNTGIGSAIRTSPTNGLWVVWYEDTEKKPDVFFGDGAEAAARAKFASANDNWSCHLLTRICSPVYGSCGLVAGHAGQHNAKPASFKQEMSDERTRQPSVGSAQPSAPLELQVSVRREPSVPLAAVVQDEQIRPLVPDLPEVKHSVERIGPEMENNCDWEAAFDAEMALSEAISERNKRNFYAALERFPKLASSVERLGEDTGNRCCADGQKLRMDPCAKCPNNPHVTGFLAWLETYTSRTEFHRGDMAAAYYAGKRTGTASAIKGSGE